MNQFRFCMLWYAATGRGKRQLKGYLSAYVNYFCAALVFVPARRKEGDQGISGFLFHQCRHQRVLGRRRQYIVDEIRHGRRQHVQPQTMQLLGIAATMPSVAISCTVGPA